MQDAIRDTRRNKEKASKSVNTNPTIKSRNAGTWTTRRGIFLFISTDTFQSEQHNISLSKEILQFTNKRYFISSPTADLQ